MKRHRVSRFLASKKLLPLLAGGMALQSLSGCDPEVRDTILTGIQNAITSVVTSMVNAFFMALQSAGTSATSQPVVKAVFHDLTTWLS